MQTFVVVQTIAVSRREAGLNSETLGQPQQQHLHQLNQSKHMIYINQGLDISYPRNGERLI